ncbi:MAG: peptidase U32 [Chloroflexi bacterium]|nr:peptidase U32 [Chloroflexota bacterium]
MVRKSARAELLMPAGSLEKLKTAVLYGADAVYLGTPDMSLRTQSAFTLEEVLEGIAYAHKRGKRVYLTLNLFSHNKDIEKLSVFIETIRKVQPDGLIIADPGIFQYVRQHAPELDLHISTQANVCSWLSVQFWEAQGASLVVMAREVTFDELREIREKCPDVKLEAFVHGAMCMTYSGRCLLSNYLTERGANQGNCAQSCRWNYKVKLQLKDGTLKEIVLNEHNKELFNFLLEEAYRPGDLMTIEEDERGSYILNAKDLCLLPKLDDYLQLGVDSLKVEGRNKGPYYAAVVARAYRMAIDDWYEDPENWSYETYMEEILTVPNRGFSLAFHDGRLQNYAHNYEDAHSLAEYEFAGFVTAVCNPDQYVEVEVKNRIFAGEVLEFVCPEYRDIIRLRLYEFVSAADGSIREVVHPGQSFRFRIPFATFDRENPSTLAERIPPMTVIRKERKLNQQEWERLKLDTAARGIELGNGGQAVFESTRIRVVDVFSETPKTKKVPRLGTEGCCGKGCNGCLIFAHDPLFEQARTELSQRKMGEKLSGKRRKV